jgi:hypothetical protein
VIGNISFAEGLDLEALKNAPLPDAQKAAYLTQYGYDANAVMAGWNNPAGEEIPGEDIVPEELPAEATAEPPAEVPTEKDDQAEMNYYVNFGKPLMGFKSGMSDEDKEKWENIGGKYEKGDISWNKDTNSFRQTGNFSSYIDEDGNLNGWLYAANGIGGYVAVFNGEVMESDLRPDTVYYDPSGKAYVIGEDGKLKLDGEVLWVRYGEYIGPKMGYYHDGDFFWSTDENGKFMKYDYATAPDSVLERAGYYRGEKNGIWPIDDQYRMAQAFENGDITAEEFSRIQALKNIEAIQQRAEEKVEYPLTKETPEVLRVGKDITVAEADQMVFKNRRDKAGNIDFDRVQDMIEEGEITLEVVNGADGKVIRVEIPLKAISKLAKLLVQIRIAE